MTTEMQHRVMFRRTGEVRWTSLTNKRTGQPMVYSVLSDAENAAAAVRGFKVSDIETRISGNV